MSSLFWCNFYRFIVIGILVLLLNSWQGEIYAQESTSSISKRGGIAFRTDDDQQMAKYLEYAGIFNRYNKKFTYALNLGTDVITQSYINGVKQLQASGHEMMDHTPWHSTPWFKTKLSTDYYLNHPGVHRINSDNIELKFADVNINSAKRSGYVDVKGDTVKSFSGIFSNFVKSDCYLFFPRLNQLVYVKEFNWIDANTIKVSDVWGNGINLGTYQNIQFYNFDFYNVHLTTDALRALAEETLRLAIYYGLQRPYSWIQPGGYHPQVSSNEIRLAISTLGYSSAGVFSNVSLKVFNEYNPSNDRQFGMNWGDFQEQVWTFEQIKGYIADRIAKHQVVFGESHFNSQLDGWSGLLDRTEKLIQWCISNNIPIRTYSEWADILYNQTPDPYENMFPPLNVDLDANGIPDGYDKNNQGVLITNDGKPSANDYSYSINSVGQICSITNLGGVEKGENNFEIWTKGSAGNFIEVTFKAGSQDLVYKFPAESNEWTKYTLSQSINGNKSLNIPNNISVINVKIRCSNFNSGEVRISGMKMNKSSGIEEYLTVSPSSQYVSSLSGTTNFNISSNISWNINPNASWLNISPLSGNGNSTINVGFTNNTALNDRTGNITVSGGNQSKIVSVIQQGFSPYLNVSPKDRTVSNLSGNTTFSIESNTSWSISDDAEWLTSSPESGTGNATITTSFVENPITSQRIANISISGEGINNSATVTQSGAPTILEVAPTDWQVAWKLGSIAYSITSNTSWTIVDDADWLTLDHSSGSNNSTINVHYDSNSNYQARVAELTLTGGGKSLSWKITQEAYPYLSISPEVQNIGHEAGSTSFTIQSNRNWVIDNNLDWLSITPLEGFENATTEILFTANLDTIERIGQISVVADTIVKTLTLVQESSPFLVVSPSEIFTSYEEGKVSFAIQSNRNWTIENNSYWLTITPINGSENGIVEILYTANTDSIDRSDSISISADGIIRTLVIKQESSPILSVIPEEQFVNFKEGTLSFIITTNRDWISDNDSEWLTIIPVNGSGNGIIEVSFRENTESVERTAKINFVADALVTTATIIQESSPVFLISPVELYVNHEEGTTTFSIQSNRDWTLEENLEWLEITPSSGSGNGSIEISFSANYDSLERIGQITAAADGIIRTLNIIQESTPKLDVTPAELIVSDTSGTAVFIVSSNRSWNASVNADWLVLSSSQSDSNLLNVNYSVNPDTLERTGQIQLICEDITRAISVTQAARKYLAVYQNHFVVSSDSGSIPLEIYSNVAWEINEDLEWLELSKHSGSNSDTVFIHYDPNMKTLLREGTIVLKYGYSSYEIFVRQEGSLIQFVVNPKRSKVSADSGSVSITVNTNTIWHVQNSYHWLSLNPDSGEGNIQVIISFKSNQDSLARIGTINFIADTVKINYVLEQNGLEVFQISALVDSIGSGQTVGSGRYLFGASATVSAHPLDGWKFKFWAENNTTVSTDSVYTFKVMNSRMLIAKFERVLTTVSEFDVVVDKFDLFQNYPNPFNPSTRIKFSVPYDTQVKISVFDAFGEKVEDLFQSYVRRGYHEVTFNGDNLASGIYFCRMQASDFILTKKMVLIK